MSTTKNGFTTVTPSWLRMNMSEALGKVRFGGDVMIIRRRGKEFAALVPMTALEKIKSSLNKLK